MIFIIHIHNHNTMGDSVMNVVHLFVFYAGLITCDNAYQMILYTTCVSCCTISAMSC